VVYNFARKRKKGKELGAELADGERRLVFETGFGLGNVFVGEGLEFAADDVGGKAGAEEAAVHGSELAVVDFAAEGAQLAFETLADQGGFVGLRSGFGEGGLNVAIGNTAGAEIAGDAEFALAANFGALAGELFGVALVVNEAVLFEELEDEFDEFVVVRAASEMLLHFVDGIGAAHEGADGGIVEGGLGFGLARPGEHE
jgi:hypothetical protein